MDITTEIVWPNGSPGLGNFVWLLLVSNGVVTAFAGKSVPGIATVRAEEVREKGRVVYRLALAHGVRPITGYDGTSTLASIEGLHHALRGVPGSFKGWDDVARAFDLPVPTIQTFLHGWRPKIAEAIEQADAAAPFVALEGLRDGALPPDVAAGLIECAVARGLVGWNRHPDREDIALRALIVIDYVIDGKKVTERLGNAALAFTELFTTAKLVPFGPSVNRRAGSIRQSVILRLRALRESVRTEQAEAESHFDDDPMTPRDP